MLFNSYEFLFLLLPLSLAGYYFLPKWLRLPLLTVRSYVFYGWWDYRFVGLMLWTTLFDYVAGRVIGSTEKPGRRRLWLTFSVICNLALLGFFKYFDLLASSVNGVASSFRGASLSSSKNGTPSASSSTARRAFAPTSRCRRTFDAC